MASRQSLKLASSVRFTPSQPLPGRSAAGRCSLTADVDGSSPRLRAFPHPGSLFFLRAHRPKERTERYERSDWGSTPHAPAIGPSSNWKRRSPPKREIWGSSPLGSAKFNLAVVARFFWGGRQEMSMRFLIARLRVRFPPRLPDFLRGRLTGRAAH